jgi:predicted nucleic acid-binding protein
VARYLLDTNVVSEPMRPHPASAVLRWFEARDPLDLFLSSITLGELVAGVRRLGPSARRRSLERWLDEVLTPQFRGRILAFDVDAAWRWGALVSDFQSAGRPRPAIDLQIAAIAAHHGLVIVTRNMTDFAGLGLELVDPWSD